MLLSIFDFEQHITNFGSKIINNDLNATTSIMSPSLCLSVPYWFITQTQTRNLGQSPTWVRPASWVWLGKIGGG